MIDVGGHEHGTPNRVEQQERAIRAFEWSGTSLGPIERWPQKLTTLFELMMASAQPMFLAWGPERLWLYNDAFIEIARRKHPDSLGRPIAEVWSEAWSDLGPLVDRVFAGEAVHRTGFKVGLDRGGDAEEAFFDFSFTPVCGPAGTVDGLFCVTLETTARVLGGRKQLVDAEAQRDRLFQMSRDLFGVATFDGRLKTINPAWARQLGRPQDFLLTHTFEDIIHPDDLAVTGNVIATLQSGKPVHQFHVRLLKEDGSAIPFAWSAVPDGTPGSNIFYTVGRDISVDVAAAAELEQAQEALRQAQKMEAVGQLTGGIAHDFNNLLGGISGSLEMLGKRVAQGRYTEIDKYIVGAQGAVKRAASLTHRLLAFSRRQTLDPRPTDVNLLVDGIAELVRSTVGPHIETKIVNAPDSWTATVDQNQLENALLNLCINARDAMPDGGRLLIQTANLSFDRGAAEQLNLQPGQYVSLCVKDTGTGMAPEVIERAFEPFYTTKPIGQGTGLGLSMIYGFARQSGGGVHISSEVGNGTTICIYLPRHDGLAIVGSDELPEQPMAAKDGSGTILIVDDEPAIRLLVADVLEDLGFRTLQAEDGPSGLNLLGANPQIDLLVTDVGLPGGMNGRQVADAAREVRPGLKVLFITGYAAKAALGEDQLEAGMQVLVKPFAMDTLAAKVSELVLRRGLS